MTYVEIIRVVFIVVHVYYKYYDSMPRFLTQNSVPSGGIFLSYIMYV